MIERIKNWFLDHFFLLLIIISVLFSFFFFISEASDGFSGWPEWTGFSGYIKSNGEIVRQKTLWDLMDLLIVPIILAAVIFWLDSSQKKRELEIAAQQRKQSILEHYYDQMAELLLNHDLLKSNDQSDKNNTVRSIAKARTFAALKSLDGDRKGQLVFFLQNSGLIRLNEPVIMFHERLSHREEPVPPEQLRADLTKANLSGAILLAVNLSGANLVEADLSDAILLANFQNANLSKASLKGAAILGGNFEGAILDGANLIDVKGHDSLLLKAKSLKNAIMNDGKKYEEWIKGQR